SPVFWAFWKPRARPHPLQLARARRILRASQNNQQVEKTNPPPTNPIKTSFSSVFSLPHNVLTLRSSLEFPEFWKSGPGWVPTTAIPITDMRIIPTDVPHGEIRRTRSSHNANAAQRLIATMLNV